MQYATTVLTRLDRASSSQYYLGIVIKAQTYRGKLVELSCTGVFECLLGVM